MRAIYRTESFSGSGCRDAREVMLFEMTQLGNSDIPKFCLRHYPFPPEEHMLVRTVTSNIDHNRQDTEAAERAVAAILRAVRRKTGKDVTSVLWLSGLKAVEQTYARGEAAVVDVYEPSDIILSDLGEDGILYGYGKPPQKTASFSLIK